jgi:hypothetical protein
VCVILIKAYKTLKDLADEETKCIQRKKVSIWDVILPVGYVALSPSDILESEQAFNACFPTA